MKDREMMMTKESQEERGLQKGNTPKRTKQLKRKKMRET
jgi:hypothetical protein